MKKIIALMIWSACALPFTHAFFSDVATDNPNYTAIKALYDQKVIEGYSDNTFKPHAFVNRAEALKIITSSVFTDIPKSITQSGFVDVKNSEWFAPFVFYAKDKNIIGGYPDGSFKGGNLINFGEILKMSTRTYGISPNLIYSEKDFVQSFPEFKSNEWFLPYIQFAKMKNLGVNIHPGAYPTRGQMAEIIYRLKTIREYDIAAFDAELIPLYASVRTSLGYSPSSATGTKELVIDISAPLTTGTGSTAPSTGSGSTTGTTSTPLDFEISQPLKILESSPMLSGKNLTLSQPFLLYTSIADNKEKLLDIANNFMNEGDILALAWSKNTTIAKDVLSVMQGELASLRNTLTSTKNVIINGTSNTPEKVKEVLNTMWEAKKSIIRLYGKTYLGILEGNADAKDIMSTLSQFSSLSAYKKLAATFTDIEGRASGIKTKIGEIQTGSDDVFIIAAIIGDFGEGLKLIDSLDAMYMDLVKEASGK